MHKVLGIYKIEHYYFTLLYHFTELICELMNELMIRVCLIVQIHTSDLNNSRPTGPGFDTRRPRSSQLIYNTTQSS